MDFIQTILHNCFLKFIDPGDKLITRGNTTVVKIRQQSFTFVFHDDKITLSYTHHDQEQNLTYTSIKEFIEGFNHFSKQFNFNSHVGRIIANVNLSLTLGKD